MDNVKRTMISDDNARTTRGTGLSSALIAGIAGMGVQAADGQPSSEKVRETLAESDDPLAFDGVEGGSVDAEAFVKALRE